VALHLEVSGARLTLARMVVTVAVAVVSVGVVPLVMMLDLICF
jgi:hypothetical protein